MTIAESQRENKRKATFRNIQLVSKRPSTHQHGLTAWNFLHAAWRQIDDNNGVYTGGPADRTADVSWKVYTR